MQNEAKQWWSSFAECRAAIPPLTWAQFQNVFFKKYVPHTYRGQKKDEFLWLEQGNMFVEAYEAKFHCLSYYVLHLINLEEEQIRYF